MKNQRTDIEKGKLVEDEKKIKTDDKKMKKVNNTNWIFIVLNFKSLPIAMILK